MGPGTQEVSQQMSVDERTSLNVPKPGRCGGTLPTSAALTGGSSRSGERPLVLSPPPSSLLPCCLLGYSSCLLKAFKNSLLNFHGA